MTQWINIENEHGDEVLMRWPEGKPSKSHRAASNFFWICVGLVIIIVAAIGLCEFGIFFIRALVELF
jgi:hypothetical protein